MACKFFGLLLTFFIALSSVPALAKSNTTKSNTSNSTITLAASKPAKKKAKPAKSSKAAAAKSKKSTVSKKGKTATAKKATKATSTATKKSSASSKVAKNKSTPQKAINTKTANSKNAKAPVKNTVKATVKGPTKAATAGPNKMGPPKVPASTTAKTNEHKKTGGGAIETSAATANTANSVNSVTHPAPAVAPVPVSEAETTAFTEEHDNLGLYVGLLLALIVAGAGLHILRKKRTATHAGSGLSDEPSLSSPDQTGFSSTINSNMNSNMNTNQSKAANSFTSLFKK